MYIQIVERNWLVSEKCRQQKWRSSYWYVQSRHFGKEIVLLSKQKKLEANNRLFKPDQYVDAQGVLRVGSRTQKSLIQQEMQHAVIYDQPTSSTMIHPTSWSTRGSNVEEDSSSRKWLSYQETGWVKKLPLCFVTLICLGLLW